MSVLSAPDRHGRAQRYLSVSPGMIFGETAMLHGGGRTAGAVADAPTDVHSLTLDALDALGRSHPALAIRLHRNIALHLLQRLRGAAGAWRAGTRRVPVGAVNGSGGFTRRTVNGIDRVCAE